MRIIKSGKEFENETVRGGGDNKSVRETNVKRKRERAATERGMRREEWRYTEKGRNKNMGSKQKKELDLAAACKHN